MFVILMLLLLVPFIILACFCISHYQYICCYFRVLFRPAEDVATIRILERRWMTSLQMYLWRPMPATFLMKSSWRHVDNKYGAQWKSTDSVMGMYKEYAFHMDL